MTTVNIQRRGQVSVQLNRHASGVLTPTSQRVSIIPSTGTQLYMREILDVVEGTPQDGDTLVYNADTNKYEVKEIEIDESNIDLTEIDGGTF